MDYMEKIIIEIEIQSVAGIRECFENGISPNDLLRNEPLIYEVISEYGRGPKFKECIKVFVDCGLQFDDPVLLSVLLDDAASLEKQLIDHPGSIHKKYSLRCTFTPLFEASLLHICAEFNHLSCAKVLVQQGADINNRAGVDEYGFGGQTPVFHTVNQYANFSMEMLDWLLEQSARLDINLKGLIWGRSYEWETYIPAVNPISYAMMGLLRQFQRTEKNTYEVVNKLMKAAFGIDYHPKNIPNLYLQS